MKTNYVPRLAATRTKLLETAIAERDRTIREIIAQGLASPCALPEGRYGAPAMGAATVSVAEPRNWSLRNNLAQTVIRATESVAQPTKRSATLIVAERIASDNIAASLVVLAVFLGSCASTILALAQ